MCEMCRVMLRKIEGAIRNLGDLDEVVQNLFGERGDGRSLFEVGEEASQVMSGAYW